MLADHVLDRGTDAGVCLRCALQWLKTTHARGRSAPHAPVRLQAGHLDLQLLLECHAIALLVLCCRLHGLSRLHMLLSCDVLHGRVTTLAFLCLAALLLALLLLSSLSSKPYLHREYNGGRLAQERQERQQQRRAAAVAAASTGGGPW
jgi:hypothetical protein